MSVKLASFPPWFSCDSTKLFMPTGSFELYLTYN